MIRLTQEARLHDDTVNAIGDRLMHRLTLKVYGRAKF